MEGVEGGERKCDSESSTERGKSRVHFENWLFFVITFLLCLLQNQNTGSQFDYYLTSLERRVEREREKKERERER